MDDLIRDAQNKGLISFELAPKSDWYKNIIRATKSVIFNKIQAIEYARINCN